VCVCVLKYSRFLVGYIGFNYFNYVHQVNGVNGGDTVFVRCVSVCVCVCSGLVNNSSKTVKATDFKFDKHVPRDSPDMTP